MKKVLALFLFLTTSLAISGPPTISLSPDTISSNEKAPLVCISGFRANSFVSVELPQISYGFIVGERGMYCYQSDYIMQGLAAGTYEVTSMVCRYSVGSIPSKCKDGPTAILTVE